MSERTKFTETKTAMKHWQEAYCSLSEMKHDPKCGKFKMAPRPDT